MANSTIWSGFSDEDLKKMRLTSLKDEPKQSCDGSRQLMNKWDHSRAQGKGKTKRTSAANQASKSEKHTFSDSIETDTTTTGTKQGMIEICHQMQSESASINSSKCECDNTYQTEKPEVKELDENEVLHIELSNVQKFQQRQKLIEEANKQKRALLSKAIEDRRKKAKAEAEKLMRVQQELNHLDSLLTADVSIIRDKIETASLEYMEAQKRYERAEKEFITAKMDLFAKGEAKEHLTEHLYTIIHQNEVRKAKKLVELMEKLSMEVTAEEMELTIPAIPQLTNFTAVATIQDPHQSDGKKKPKDATFSEPCYSHQINLEDEIASKNNMDKNKADCLDSQPSNAEDFVQSSSRQVSSAKEQRDHPNLEMMKESQPTDFEQENDLPMKAKESSLVSQEHLCVPVKYGELEPDKADLQEEVTRRSELQLNGSDINKEDQENMICNDGAMLPVDSGGWTFNFT